MLTLCQGVMCIILCGVCWLQPCAHLFCVLRCRCMYSAAFSWGLQHVTARCGVVRSWREVSFSCNVYPIRKLPVTTTSVRDYPSAVTEVFIFRSFGHKRLT